MDNKQLSNNFSQLSFRHSELSHKMNKLKNILCKCGKQTKMVCIDKMCQAPALICQEQNSQCGRKLHNTCFLISFQSISSKIYSKMLGVGQYSLHFNKRTEQFINSLIQEVYKVQDVYRDYVQTNYSQVVLNDVQKKILEKVQKNEINQMKGLQFAQIFNEMNQTNENKDDLIIKQDHESIKKVWENIQINTKKLIGQFKTHLHLNFKFKSSIVKTQQEKDVLLKFFQKKAIKVNLLYKASQNQFKLDNFYKYCTNIPNTLVLMETEYGKKVGGYTPIVWKKGQNFEFIPDNSNSTFIFSLTNNQKLKQTSNTESGIFYFKNTGPHFGSKTKCDLKVCQFANAKNTTVDFNYGYNNENYKERNQMTRQSFSGTPHNTFETKLKEWEVWEVIYE